VPKSSAPISKVSGLGDIQQRDQGVLPDLRSFCALQGARLGDPEVGGFWIEQQFSEAKKMNARTYIDIYIIYICIWYAYIYILLYNMHINTHVFIHKRYC
jgi:hypothetical protein